MQKYTTDILANEFSKTPRQIRQIIAAVSLIHPDGESFFPKVGRSIEVSQEGHDQIALYIEMGDDDYRDLHGKSLHDRTPTEPDGQVTGKLSVAQSNELAGNLNQETSELPTEINQEDGFEINQAVMEGRTKAIREVALELEELDTYQTTKAQLQHAVRQQKASENLTSATSLFGDVISRHQAREKGTQVVRNAVSDNNELLKALGLGK